MPINKTDTLKLELDGEIFIALPMRGLWWPKRNCLIISDTHFGKDETFRKAGVPLPHGTDDESLERLSALLDYTCAMKLWVLGDFLHGPIDESTPFTRSFKNWLTKYPKLEITVTIGNHDRHQLDKSILQDVEWISEIKADGFVLTHDSRLTNADFVLSGHVHPVYRISDSRKSSKRIPVFWIRNKGIILPAFSTFTGGKTILPQSEEQLVGALDNAAFKL